MKIKLIVDGKPHHAYLPYHEAPCAEVEDWTCACGHNRVRGTGKSIDGRDEYVAAAVCNACSAPAGELRVTMNTIFGLEEDEDVLNGRCRVY